MNDSEQYHTGRAAAYDTMTEFLGGLLRAHPGGVPAHAVRDLQAQAHRWQVAAEEAADARGQAERAAHAASTAPVKEEASPSL